jgi:hypothetical protein
LRRVAILPLTFAVALAATPAAGAHLRSGAVATDYRASIAKLASTALVVRIYKTDRAVAITVRPGHQVTVIGYLGEPFIRVSDDGVFVDRHSPTAAADGLVSHAARSRTPEWRIVSRGRSVVWHTAGLRGLPSGIERASWKVPVVVDGERASLQGEIWRVPAPPAWPWLLLGAPVVLPVVLFVWPFRSSLRDAAGILGALAGAATIAVAAAFALAPSANGGHWVEAANELVFVLVGFAVLVRGSSNARMFAALGLGLLALGVGLSKVPVLLHGVVLSAFPATPTRLAVAAAFWIGAGATALGLVAFFELLDEPEPWIAAVRHDRTRGS